ncbi:D-glucuronyl C5-epimerase B-like [Brevipalpus obovatus]|uniref:D-glucuronyl C5-epimerase B-like n=1 Tax=Brevipalpus obovatus TaxID=246614 RepID=UPI003D9E0E5B
MYSKQKSSKMRLPVRRSHIYLLFLFVIFTIGWFIIIRLDGKLKVPRGDVLRPSVKSERWLRKHDGSGSSLNPLAGNWNLKDLGGSSMKRIDCLINNEYSISCLKSRDGVVHVPFNFVKKYFDIDGHLVKTGDGREYLSWEHSYSKIYRPKKPYNSSGPFLWFENYNVEVRDRVKCISGSKGVPISTQWEPNGHFYPIQIAQFGLSHFSKNLTLGKPRVLVLEDGSLKQDQWIREPIKKDSSGLPMIHPLDDYSSHGGSNGKVVYINGDKISFKLKKRRSNSDLSLSVRLKPSSNFSMTVFLISDSGKEYSVSYAPIDEDFVDDETTYGFGAANEAWTTLARDVGVDLQKAYSTSGRKLSAKSRGLHVSEIVFKGQTLLDDLLLSSSIHEPHFFAAVKWLMESQDRQGGWPIKVTRKLSSGSLVLQPGWYSAMAQGQGISLLTRMYQYTKNETYLKAAIRALALFDGNSTNGGIRTYFLDKYVWFEEYPTVPSSFVLNGFIYSLFGLYDLKNTCEKLCIKSTHLFEDGLNSLRQLLPLFDNGFGTLYDLRHLSLKSEPKLARWDYHTTHINQLLYLNSFLNESQFSNTAKRWIGYMKGRRAPHN